jgi:hypothetical protein
MSVIQAVTSDITFWIGLASVVLFAYSRFNVSLPDTDELSPPLSPRFFTTNFRFQLAALVYVGVYTFVYFFLLIAASVPALQEQLVKYFGSVKDAGTIGTPAGAALIATSVLPSVPGFTRFDAWARAQLQAFASIPAKAWIIGQEMLEALGILPEEAIAPDARLEDVRSALHAHKRIFDDLSSLWTRLTQVEQYGPGRRYMKFFGDFKKVADKLQESFAIEPNHLTTVETARYVEIRVRAALNRAARFTGCAALNAEGSEYAVRSRLNEKGIHVAEGAFNFGPAQLIVAAFAIAVSTVAGVFISIGLFALEAPAAANEILGQNLGLFFAWGALADLTYILPLVLAAGIEMYLLDQAVQNSNIRGIDRAAAALLNFLGAAGLAFVSMLAWSYLRASLVPPEIAAANPAAATVDPFRILPWVRPAATVSTIFLLMAARRGAGGWAGAAIDGLVHGIGAAAASGIALVLFELHYDFGGVFPNGLMAFVAPITAGLVGFSIGIVVCFTARQQVSHAKPFRLRAAIP